VASGKNPEPGIGYQGREAISLAIHPDFQSPWSGHVSRRAQFSAPG
jgi:hypothetical protein